MERARFALIAALMLLVVSAAPAFAQKDPFEPVPPSGSNGSSGGDADGPFTQPDSGGDSGDTGSDPTSDDGQNDPTTQPDTNNPETDPQVQPNNDSLPNTGAEPVSWLALAYTLIAVGGGFLVAGRFLHPAFVQRSDIPRRYQPRHSKRRTS